MTNHEIAGRFSLLSKLMDIHGENSFKAKSYSIAAFTIEKLPEEVAGMDDGVLFSLRGIGQAIGQKVRELQHTGQLAALEQIVAVTPPGILDIMRVKGLGPKKIAVIWKEMGVESLGELEYACNENRLALLKGFGAKSQENVLQGIAFIRKNEGFHLWAEVEPFAEQLLESLRAAFPGGRFSLTGAIRRQVEVISMVELVTDQERQSLLSFFTAAPETVCEQTKADAIDMIDGLRVQVPGQPLLRICFSAPGQFYQTLFRTTGTEDFTAAYITQHSLSLPADSEEAIFESAGLPFIAPALRESAGIIPLAFGNALPALIAEKDIKGIIHSHSTWSDGLQSLETMAIAARDQGFEYLVISDHSRSAYYANGLSPERIAAQHQEIDALNARLAPFRVFKSIESDILGDGSLDYSDSVLQTFDLVIASVHSNLKMSQERAMDRLLTAIRNPYTTILGHPTGRLLLSRDGYPLDHKIIIDACAEHSVVIEINAHPRRLDLDWRWIGYAMERGVLLSVDPDAHSVQGFRDIRYGVLSAQKGGLTATHNLSSFSLQEFEKFLEGCRIRRDGIR